MLQVSNILEKAGLRLQRYSLNSVRQITLKETRSNAISYGSKEAGGIDRRVSIGKKELVFAKALHIGRGEDLEEGEWRARE